MTDGDVDMDSDSRTVKTMHRYQVYRGMSPTPSNRLELSHVTPLSPSRTAHTHSRLTPPATHIAPPSA